MHIYYLNHVGTKRKVTTSCSGIEVNTREDFPWFAVDFSGELCASNVADNLSSKKGFLTAFDGQCYFDKKGRRFDSTCNDTTHDSVVAYVEGIKVYAVLDQLGWPLTCEFKNLDAHSLPYNAVINGTSSNIMPFRKPVPLISNE